MTSARLCEREAVPYWWCIGDECKHVRRLVGKKDNYHNNNCAHPTVIKQLPPDVLHIVGYPVVNLPMCPVLTDILLGDD